MRKGKMAAQVAHASLKIFFDRLKYYDSNANRVSFILTVENDIARWMNGAFTKVVVGVNSLEELEEIETKVKSLKIPNAKIIDNGVTEFHNEKTVTCLAIGPIDANLINPITGNLPLL